MSVTIDYGTNYIKALQIVLEKMNKNIFFIFLPVVHSDKLSFRQTSFPASDYPGNVRSGKHLTGKRPSGKLSFLWWKLLTDFLIVFSFKIKMCETRSDYSNTIFTLFTHSELRFQFKSYKMTWNLFKPYSMVSIYFLQDFHTVF